MSVGCGEELGRVQTCCNRKGPALPESHDDVENVFQTGREQPGWSSGPADIACGRPDLGRRHDPHRTLYFEPPVRMTVHTTGDMGGSRGKVLAHPSPQVHLFVDSMKATGWQAHSVRGFLSGR